MTERSVVVMGLPGSGKTTYLAALWHVTFSRETETVLRFGSLKDGNQKHLNAIAARWRNAQMQERTQLAGDQLVRLSLIAADDAAVTVTFPDVAGESYRKMWEDRECEQEVADTLNERGVLLFIHADNIKSPMWVADIAAMSRQLGLRVVEGQPVPWHPRLAPTQVQIVGLLDLLMAPPLDIGKRRLAVMLSAWDKAKGEGLGPNEFLKEKMPLLGQYLESNSENWDWKIYGVSAQGGDYDDTQANAVAKREAEVLRAVDVPTHRIELNDGETSIHDLTVPLAWLIG